MTAQETPDPTAWAPPDAPQPDAPQPEALVPADPPPTAPQPPFTSASRRTNRIAIAALAAGLLGLILFAVGFAVAAFVQTGRRGEKGRGLAIGGLAASVAWVAVAVAMTGGPSGSGTEHGQVRASALRAGDCFKGAAAKGTDLVTVMPCTQPHDSEVIARSTLPEEPYPGPEELYLRALELCTDRGLYLQKSRYHENLDPHLFGPDQKSWWSGDRVVTCLMHHTGASGPLTSPLAQTIDPRLKLYHELKVGDCVDDFSEKKPVTATVPCTEPHRSQVYATFWLPLDAEYAPGDYPPYLGSGVVKKKAKRFCGKEARKLFDEHPPPVGVQQQYAAPTEQNWENGIRAIVCLARATKPLKHSLLPK